MNLRKKLFAVSAAAVFGAVTPQAFADDGKDGHKNCEPEILSSSVQPTPTITAVSGVCLDLLDAVSTSGTPTTKPVKVEAWVDGGFVTLALNPPATTGNRYTKNGTTNVLETIAVCSATDKGDGITTVRITRPYLTTGGKAKSTTGESQVAVAFDGGCPPPI
jgi:hypothetical protein